MKTSRLVVAASALAALFVAAGWGLSDSTVLLAEAAEPEPQSCPTVTVNCARSVPDGTPAHFTANVAGGDPDAFPLYNWSVSAATIYSGQGTSSVMVDTTGVGGQTVKATVDVLGYPADCNTSASCSVVITK